MWLFEWIASWDMSKSDKDKENEWLGQSHALYDLERRQKELDRRGLNTWHI